MTLPAVIFAAPHETEKLLRLRQYCTALDGTSLLAITATEPEGMDYPGIANWAVKQCCKAMAGTAFMYVECDSIPLRVGWLEAISEAYAAQDKLFLWADRFNPPHDLIGGIGVFPPNADELIPDGIVDDGFDGWMRINHPDWIGGTPLIRHSHSFHDTVTGETVLHEFPRDLDIIGPDAVIFHKDATQSLINCKRKGLLPW
jgi:hypothetical protein